MMLHNEKKSKSGVTAVRINYLKYQQDDICLYGHIQWREIY